jgi:hypothetical protein
MVESLGHAQGVADLHPGDEAGAHSPAKPGILAKTAQSAIF